MFSRFIVYSFDEVSEFKTDLFSKKIADINSIFEKEGLKIYDYYGKLKELNSEIEFSFTHLQ
ncbi:hypothetical protein, partial [Chryseobacterium sp. SIMBA_028]|uniref:hypothetical protein n=1 Tax=Chryseobacterium sp. SIMBA_028 TaxID=3085771 RepID=UPI00397D4FBD